MKTNYDLVEYDVDFKQLAKQRKEREKLEAQAQNLKTYGTSHSVTTTRSQEEKRGIFRTGQYIDSGIKNKN